PRPHLDRHLVVRAADAAAADLEDRRQRLDRLLEHLDGRLAAPLADDRKRVVDHAFGKALLAVQHHPVHDLADELRLVDRVRDDRARLDFGAARHQLPRLAPYFDRAWRRSATPAVSSAARITLYRMPGRSATRPPRTSTTECSCRLWPSPGI